MRIVRHLAVGLLLTLPLACSKTVTTEPVGDFTVRVFNGSPVAVSNIRVIVSEKDEFTISRLEHGDMSSPHNARLVHTDPFVSLTVDGQTLTSNPVEGFSGFNPPRTPGAYVIVVTVVGSPRRLDVSVTQPVE